jgi:DNA mismatch repair protein MutS2
LGISYKNVGFFRYTFAIKKTRLSSSIIFLLKFQKISLLLLKNMIYPDNFEQKTGFDRIRQLVADRCLSQPGREKVEAMAFSADHATVVNQLTLVREFTQVLAKADNFPVDGFCDLRESLRKIRIEGAFLLEKELFDLGRSLEAVNAVVCFFKNQKSDDDRPEILYPHLHALAADVATFPHIVRQIGAILDRFGRIRDNASPALAEIRRQIAQTVSGISKTLNTILRSAQTEGLVEKDVAPSMRDGRLVIPIPPAFKRKIRGIVHDESSTGKTVFIEPQEVVEANNRVRELENEEKREIVRILTEITDLIRPELSEIVNSNEFLSEIDFIRAKALFATDIDAIMPDVTDSRMLDWRRAIHPLLLLAHRKAGKTVVPLNIELSGDAAQSGNAEENHSATESGCILLVSGPNAGGKSVLLKTVGLLQYMLQSGLLIPVGERSRAGIFSKIFIDIGDEQSIENDLSTYSSHLNNMKFMLRHADNDTLILIDEFGGGTEPRIGGAIAEALLDRFVRRGCFGVITTHYHNLKTYAEDHAGVVNGAMLYDRNGMRPLFQLAVGKPGSSFAVEIARNIGLPEDLIADASEKAGQDYINLDRYLQDIVRDKRYWEQKRQDIRRQEKQLEELKNRYRNDIENIKAEKKAFIDKARTDAANLLDAANAEIEKTIREIKEAQAEKEKTKEIRQGFQNFKQEIVNPDKNTNPNRVSNPVRVEKVATPKNKSKKSKTLAIGSSVRLKGQQTVGTIIDCKDDFYIVAFGAIKTNVKSAQIEPVKSQENAKTRKGLTAKTGIGVADIMEKRKLQFKPEIDIRGMRGDEALQAVIYYIDDAIQCAAGRIRILHGTGTGALRQIVRDYLRTVDGVSHFGDEHVQFGGAGITVVDLE